MPLESPIRPIVIVQPHLEYGGAERQTVIFANALVSMGYPCTIVLHARQGGLIDDLDQRVKLISLDAPGHVRVPIAAIRLRRVLRELGPSFVVVKLWSSIMCTAMIDRSDPRHAYNYCEDLDPTDHIDYIRFGRLKQWVVGRIFRSRALLTANTHQVARSMADVYGLSSIPDVVSSAVDVELVRNRAAEPDAAPASLRRNALNVVTVGSLIERKGLRGIWEGLRAAGVPIRWHVVGAGPLRDWIAGLDDPTVDVIAYGGHANPYRIMRDADLLVHGATSEAFGIVILEALAVDTPVIAARSIGPSEMVNTLGPRPELLDLYQAGAPAELGEKLRHHADATRGVDHTMSGSEYVMPYSLSHTVSKWLKRSGAHA